MRLYTNALFSGALFSGALFSYVLFSSALFSGHLRQDHPVYSLGDFNARCRDLGSSNDNPGKQVKTIMEKKIAKHDGSYFPTFITNRSNTSPGILKNPEAFHNTLGELGPLTSSDDIPITYVYKISTAPICTETNPRFNFRKADWEIFKSMLEIIPECDQQNIGTLMK